MTTLSEQVDYFLLSCVLGMTLGFLYDFFRIKRLLFKPKKNTYIIDDILFWFLAGCLLLFSNHFIFKGLLRYYQLLGSLLGALLYMVSFSYLTKTIFCTVHRILEALYRKIRKVLLFLKRYLDFLHRMLFKNIHKGRTRAYESTKAEKI